MLESQITKIVFGDEILPVWKNQNAIVFETSSVFIPYLDVALKSILSMAKDDNYYDIIVLTREVEYIDRKMLKANVSKYKNISLRFYDPSIIVEKYFKRNKNNYLEINYYRLALPWILKNYKSAVNLGADIVVRKDVVELLKTEFLDDEYMAGALDLGYIGRLNMNDIPLKELGLMNPITYVNADVLVFSLENIRNNFSIDDVMCLWEKYKFRCAEQDALNLMFQKHIKKLDLRWNVYPQRMTSTEHILQSGSENVNLWRKALQNPYIIHFAALPKPWDYPMVGYGDVWWMYARKSVYYEEIVRRMAMVAVESKNRFDIKNRIVNKLLPLHSHRRKIVKSIVKPILLYLSIKKSYGKCK